MKSNVRQEFVDQAVRYLMTEFLVKIEKVVGELSEEDLWWRPNEESNSIGNLLMHLEGNLRQWMIAGVAGQPDIRQRDREFAQRSPLPAKELLTALRKTVEEACEVIRGVGDDTILETHRIQVYDVSTLQSIFHVVEHFSYHTGQILYIVKLRENRDLGFYANLDQRKQRF